KMESWGIRTQQMGKYVGQQTQHTGASPGSQHRESTVIDSTVKSELILELISELVCFAPGH
ncbi:hypothetical protein ACQP3C_28970, partial [Escherichia coli]